LKTNEFARGEGLEFLKINYLCPSTPIQSRGKKEVREVRKREALEEAEI